MGFSQRGDVHFLKGVPGLSWTPFLIDFKKVWGGLGGPPETTFGRLWRTLGTLWALGGVTLGNFGSPWDHFGSFEGRFGLFGGPLWALWGSPLGYFSVWGSLCV